MIREGGGRAPLFERFLRERAVHNGGGRLLDVGCGCGEFLRIAERYGWEAYGVEVSEGACRYGREELGLKIFLGRLREMGFPDNYFDLVTLWNVLDVMVDPLGELREIRRVLRSRGCLFLRLPNFLFQKRVLFLSRLLEKGLLGRVKLSNRFSVFHPYGFSPRSIQNLLDKAGFSVSYLRNGKLSRGDPYSSLPLGEGAVKVAKWVGFLLFESLYLLSRRSWVWGPSMEVYARKLEHEGGI